MSCSAAWIEAENGIDKLPVSLEVRDVDLDE